MWDGWMEAEPWSWLVIICYYRFLFKLQQHTGNHSHETSVQKSRCLSSIRYFLSSPTCCWRDQAELTQNGQIWKYLNWKDKMQCQAHIALWWQYPKTCVLRVLCVPLTENTSSKQRGECLTFFLNKPILWDYKISFPIQRHRTVQWRWKLLKIFC